jgi:polar amino acid transport system substrate-binding protein
MQGVWDGFWWSAVTMTIVGYGDKKIESLGGKVVALIWMFTALLFISGLRASIASTILRDKGFDKIEELSTLSKSKVGTLKSTSMESFLRQRFLEIL